MNIVNRCINKNENKCAIAGRFVRLLTCVFIAAATIETVRTRRESSARGVARATAGVKTDCVSEVTVSHLL